MNKILVIDNFDSFTFNLVQIIREFGGQTIEVRRNNAIELTEVDSFDSILLSPGPGIPSEAGIIADLVRVYADRKPILGICLGHQCIGEVFGAELANLTIPFHGRSESLVVLEPNERLFTGLPERFSVGRYHSWVVSQNRFPEELEITALDDFGNVMALRHKVLDVRGVQFHPESVLTEHGPEILRNWLRTL